SSLPTRLSTVLVCLALAAASVSTCPSAAPSSRLRSLISAVLVVMAASWRASFTSSRPDSAATAASRIPNAHKSGLTVSVPSIIVLLDGHGHPDAQAVAEELDGFGGALGAGV